MDWNLANLFKSKDEKGQFFAPLWSSRSTDEWKKFLKGDYKWHDYLNPGGVLANPAQQIADPGNFFTSQEHENWVTKGKVSDRTLASAAIAGAAYGGGSLLSGLGAAGGGSASGVGSASGNSGSWLSSLAGEGGGSGSWLSNLLGRGGGASASNTGGQSMTGGIGNWLSNGFSNWGKNLMNNPDKTAIMMDQLGSGFWSGADGNPSAGIGTSMGQSNLANAQAQNQMSERAQLGEMIARALAGVANPLANVGAQEQTNTQVASAPSKVSQMPNLTPNNQPGPTSVTYKAGNNGEIISNLSSVVPKEQKGYNLKDLLPF